MAVGNQVSSFAGVVAMSLPRGARVVCAHGDFTSVLWPFLAAPGLEVSIVELEDVPAAIDARTALVAVSAVQSFDGRVADLDAIEAACTASGARSFVDATQASGWLPLDGKRFDYLAASGYKWLLSPRGVCFMSIRPEAASIVKLPSDYVRACWFDTITHNERALRYVVDTIGSSQVVLESSTAA